MWILRNTNKISWVEKKTKELVLQEIGEKRNIISHILRKKTKLIGHLIRHLNQQYFRKKDHGEKK